MIRSEYMLCVQECIIVDCCLERKKDLEKEYDVIVWIEGENLATWDRHCGMKPCLRGIV